jgi:hypothetical protein
MTTVSACCPLAESLDSRTATNGWPVGAVAVGTVELDPFGVDEVVALVLAFGEPHALTRRRSAMTNPFTAGFTYVLWIQIRPNVQGGSQVSA